MQRPVRHPLNAMRNRNADTPCGVDDRHERSILSESMGLKRWIATLGAVGSTARWAAREYQLFRTRHPNVNEIDDGSIISTHRGLPLRADS